MRQNNLRQELPHSVISILESKLKILCDICTQQVTQPKICPSCNQIFCYQCLLKYHDTYKNCPMCHEKFTLSQFLDCDCHRFIDYFRQQLKEFKKVTQNTDKKTFPYELKNFNSKELEQQEKCHLHDIPLKYFCETCSKAICSDCGMMGDQHRDHKFTRINDIYAKIKQKLNNQLANLGRKIMDYQQNSLITKKKLQKLQIQYMHIKRYTQEYYLLLIEKFQEEIKSKTICLKEVQQKNNKDIEFYELCRDGICEEIQRKSRNQLIDETDKILSSFTMQTCEPCEPLKIEESFQTVKELMPEYNNFQYFLRNFTQATTSIVYSDPFILNGVEWRLKIYPKGNGVAKGKYLSVFVQMSKADKNQKKYEYKIELLNHEMSAQNIRREYCSAFDIGQCWGYNQFILLEELEHGFLIDDTLHFIMGIRNSDYRTLSQDQSNYIAKLQASIRQRQQQRQNQIEQRNIIDDLDHPSYANQNQTKFLKFLENSSLNQQKINQKKSKEKYKQNINDKKKQQERQQKKLKLKKQQKQKRNQYQQIKNENFIYNEFQSQLKEQQRTTNNLQQNLTQIPKERISLRNQFLLTQEQFQSQEQNYMKFSLSQNKIKSKQEDIQKTKKKKNIQEQKTQPKQKGVSSSGNKFISLKELKSQKYISNNESKSSIKAEVKPQKKQKETDYLQKQEENNFKKYEFYFTESKKQPKKQESKQFHEKQMNKKDLLCLDSNKKIKSQLKETRMPSDPRQFQKIQQSKSEIFYNQIPKDYEKYEQKREKMNIKLSKNPKNSPSKIKDFMDENESRKKQITSILQQSKKLQGINDMSKNSFVQNNSGMKQNSMSQSAIKSPIKNQYKTEQKQEKRRKQRRFQQDDDY